MKRKVKIRRAMSKVLVFTLLVNTVFTSVPTVFADPTTGKDILNMPTITTPEKETTETLGSESTEETAVLNGYIGHTGTIEGTTSGTITIPGIGDATVELDTTINDITININTVKNEETVYPLVVRNPFEANGIKLNIPRELLSTSILSELDTADIVDFKNFDSKSTSFITYSPLMSSEYKRALTYLSENNLIHPFPEYKVEKDGTTIVQTPRTTVAPYQSYSNDNGIMVSDPINKADFIMTLMKAIDKVEWSRPLIVKAEDTSKEQVEPILDSEYRSEFLSGLTNMDIATNEVTLDRSKYQTESVYMNPNVYELYFTSALNNGILDITEFSDKNQFLYDYIGYQTFKTQANKDQGLKENGTSGSDSVYSYAARYPRWLTRNQAMRLDSSNPASSKIDYIPGSKPFGESYVYNTIGDGIVNQVDLKGETEPNIIAQYLTFINAEKPYASRYKQLVEELPALNRLTTKDSTAFDTNSMREVNILYNAEAAKTYFNVNEMTVLDAFNIIYKGLKAFDDTKLTAMETDIITSKFGIRFLGLDDNEKEVVNYLIAKGVINPEEYDSYILNSTLSQEDAYILLYRLSSPGARYKTDFTVTQKELEMIKQGYAQTTVEISEVGQEVTNITSSITSSFEPTKGTGYFPVYVTVEDSNKVTGYLTDSTNKKLSVDYIPITTSNKNQFIAFLVPNDYLDSSLRVNVEVSGVSKALTGIKGSGIYTIPDLKDEANLVLSKYSLAYGTSSNNKVDDIRKHLLQTTNKYDATLKPQENVQEEEVVKVAQGFQFTSGVNVYSYIDNRVITGIPSDIADTSGDYYISLLGTSYDKVDKILFEGKEIEFTKNTLKEDKRAYYTFSESYVDKELTLVFASGDEVVVTNTSLFYEVDLDNKALIPVNITAYYNYQDDLSSKDKQKEVEKALSKVVKEYAELNDVNFTYLLSTKYNFSTITKVEINNKKSLFNLGNLFNIVAPTYITKKVINSKMEAPAVNTDVTLGFNADSVGVYKFGDVNVFNGKTINSEFITELKKMVNDVTVTIVSSDSKQLHVRFVTKQRSAENLLSILLNKITINGDLKTQTKVAFVNIKSGQTEGRTGVLIPESELGKYNIAVEADKNNKKNILKNTKTGVTAYLNQAMGKAIIGNEIHNYKGSDVLYTSNDDSNYYNLAVIVELMAVDSLDASITSSGLILPYKTNGLEGKPFPASVGNALAGSTQNLIDKSSYEIVDDNLVIGGTEYADNGRMVQVVSRADGSNYIDLTTVSDISNGYMISRKPYSTVERMVIGYKVDLNLNPSSVTSNGNISSTLDSYINDIKKTPVKTLDTAAKVQNAKNNLILNNTIAHATMQTDREVATNSLTSEYATKPIINIILSPGQTDINKAYNDLINYLVTYHNQNRTATFLGSETTLAVTGDIKSWYSNQIRLNDENSPVKLNIIQTTVLTGNSIISSDGKWIVASAGNTLLKAGDHLGAQTGLAELGFRMAAFGNRAWITNPYVYAGIPVNTIPLEYMAPGSKLRLPSGSPYSVIDPISTVVYKGTTNMLYNDMAVSLVATNFVKAAITKGPIAGLSNTAELSTWNDYYAGLRAQSFIDAKGINSSFISDPFKVSMTAGNSSEKELAKDQSLSMLTEADMFKGVSETSYTAGISGTTNQSLTGKAVIPFAGSRDFSTKAISYYKINETVNNINYEPVTWDPNKKSDTLLDGIGNNTILLGKPVLRLKYGTMVVNIKEKDREGYYKLISFDSGSRYVQKVFVESPLAEIRSTIFNESLDVMYLKDVPKGGKVATVGGQVIIKADFMDQESSSYVTFINSEPISISEGSLRESLTPIALQTARLLASTTLNGESGIKIPLLNLADLSSFVPPTKNEIESVLSGINTKKELYTTVYVDNYTSEETKLLYGTVDGKSVTSTSKVPKSLMLYARFDLNPYIKVIKTEKSGGDLTYQMLGYDNKGTHANTKSLKNYARMFLNAEDKAEPLTLWEDFKGLELADLYIKDRNLHDPMFNENLVTLQATSISLRAESIGYRIKLFMYMLIISYTILLLAFLPLIHFKPVRNALRTRFGRVFLKVITVGRVEDPDEIDIREYYPQLLLVMTLTLVLYNMSFNLTFLNVLGDITYRVITTITENMKILIKTLYI